MNNLFHIFGIDCKISGKVLDDIINIQARDFINYNSFDTIDTFTSDSLTNKSNNCKKITVKDNAFKYELNIIAIEKEKGIYHFSNTNKINRTDLYTEKFDENDYKIYIDTLAMSSGYSQFLPVELVLNFIFQTIYESDIDNNKFYGAYHNYSALNYGYDESMYFVLRDGDFKLVKAIEDEEKENGILDNHYEYQLIPWLNQNTELMDLLKQNKVNDLNEKMNYIGKYLLQKKTSDDIKQREFLELFMQAGTIGFSDSQLQFMYKILN